MFTRASLRRFAAIAAVAAFLLVGGGPAAAPGTAAADPAGSVDGLLAAPVATERAPGSGVDPDG
jgi:hypothetical protein